MAWCILGLRATEGFQPGFYLTVMPFGSGDGSVKIEISQEMCGAPQRVWMRISHILKRSEVPRTLLEVEYLALIEDRADLKGWFDVFWNLFSERDR